MLALSNKGIAQRELLDLRVQDALQGCSRSRLVKVVSQVGKPFSHTGQRHFGRTAAVPQGYAWFESALDRIVVSISDNDDQSNNCDRDVVSRRNEVEGRWIPGLGL